MRRPTWQLGLVLLMLACQRRVDTGIDPTLPEEQIQVDLQAPLTVLENAASSEDPSLRGRALKRLVDVTGDDQWIQRGLYDPQDWVRRQAATALLESEVDDRQARLSAFAQRPEVDAYTASMVALRLPATDGLGPALEARSAGVSEAWQRPPLLLAHAHQSQESVTARIEGLEAEILDADLDWMLALASRLDSEAIPSLRRLGRDAEPSLALVLAAARLQLGDASAEGVFRAYLADEDPMLRLEALDVLAVLKGPPVVALLRRTAAAGLDVARWTARLSLVAMGEEDVSVLEEAAQHPSVEVRLAAMQAAERGRIRGTWLSKRAQRAVGAAIQPCLSDNAGPVRSAALRAIPDEAISDTLLEALLQDEDVTVRVEAAARLLERSR